MRVTRPSMPSPSTAHMACWPRTIDGLPYRSRVTTAEALYTITMLRHTSSSVARNNTLSDLSFLAILFLHCGGAPPLPPVAARLRLAAVVCYDFPLSERLTGPVPALATALQLDRVSSETLLGRRITISSNARGAPPPLARGRGRCERSAVISRPRAKAPASQAGAAWVPSSQSFSAKAD